MKNVVFQLVCSLAIFTQFPLISDAKRPEIIELDRIVAVVNNNVITQGELSRKQTEIIRQLEAKKTQLPPKDVLRKQILDRMVIDEIQLQMAKNSGIRISDEQLNTVIANVAQQNQLDIDSFRQRLVSEGYDFALFREQIRQDLIINKLRKNRIENKIFVSEQEVKAQLARLEDKLSLNNEYHLAHILIPVPESAKPEQIEAAKKKADEVATQLRFGADFSKMAISVSAGQNALTGGDLGWIKQGQLPLLAADVVPKLTKDEITSPIRSSSGFHILKLLDQRTVNQKHIVEQTLARHILIKPNQVLSSEKAKAKLIRIHERIASGADFGSLAKASSDDTGSATQGGDLGWFSSGMMVAEFQEVLDKLKPGELSQPFRTRYGWHIAQVLSRRQHDDTENYLSTQARKLIQKRKSSEQTRNWLRQIRDEAYVEYRLDE